MLLSETPIHPSLVRPVLVAGVEYRILVLEGTFVAALLLGVGLHLPTIAAAALVVFVLHPLLARLSKLDPQMLYVYARSLPYQSFYPRSTHPSAPTAMHRPFKAQAS